jgi:hypothetical protein
LDLTNVVKFVFVCFRGLYGAVGLYFGGFVMWFLGLKIVDKWFYFQSLMCFYVLTRLLDFGKGRMWGVRECMFDILVVFGGLCSLI